MAMRVRFLSPAPHLPMQGRVAEDLGPAGHREAIRGAIPQPTASRGFGGDTRVISPGGTPGGPSW